MSPAEPPPPASLVLLTREDCHLCEQMRSALQALGQHVALPAVTEQDVDADAQMQRRYGLKIPVLLLDGTPVCRTRLDEGELLSALRRRAQAVAGAVPASRG